MIIDEEQEKDNAGACACVCTKCRVGDIYVRHLAYVKRDESLN